MGVGLSILLAPRPHGVAVIIQCPVSPTTRLKDLGGFPEKGLGLEMPYRQGRRNPEKRFAYFPPFLGQSRTAKGVFKV